MKELLELPRGMKDFEAQETSYIEHLRRCFLEISDTYGMALTEPSPLEMLTTLETRSGPAIRDEIYYFRDKGDREVALRFDFTMGLTRNVAAQKSMRLPAKISSFGGVFRYDEPQKGRYRYFHQWDMEIYGKPSLYADMEIVEMTSKMFDAIPLKDTTIDVSHRRLAESYVRKTFESDDPALISDILRAIDKTAKKPAEAVLEEFTKKGYDKDRVQSALDFSRMRGTPDQIEERFDTGGLDSWDYLKRLMDMLDGRGIENARVNFGIVRGLDYYSGMIFEVFDGSGAGALAGGGRYDTLTSAFGRDDIGAAGVAGGVERTILAMKAQGVRPPKGIGRVAVLYATRQVQEVAHAIAALLRAHRIRADIDLADRSLRKQMDAAGGAAVAVIVGPQELEKGRILLRNMSDGSEWTVGLEDLTRDPKSALKV